MLIQQTQRGEHIVDYAKHMSAQSIYPSGLFATIGKANIHQLTIHIVAKIFDDSSIKREDDLNNAALGCYRRVRVECGMC